LWRSSSPHTWFRRRLVTANLWIGTTASSTPADDEAAAPREDGFAFEVPLPLMVLDRCEQATVVVVLERVVRFGSERPVGVGDVPAQPVGLDADRGLLPALPAGSVVGHGAERVHEVVGRRGEALAGGSVELSGEVAPLCSQLGDLAVGG
jgi:hypothetical protein